MHRTNALDQYHTYKSREQSLTDIHNKLRDDICDDIANDQIPLTEIGNIPLKFLDVSNLPGVVSDNIMTPSRVYKPFRYQFGYDMWKTQNGLFWLPEEVPMGDDVRDWNQKLSDAERSLMINVFPLFVQSDVLVADAWIHQYAKIFRPHEIQMGIAAVSNIEMVHTAAYAHLLDSLQLPEDTYGLFMEYKEMSDKYDYTAGFRMDTLTGIAVAMVVFGCLTEGLQLFASFALLMNNPRQNKLKGMGQIVSWSVRDESLHCSFVAQLYRVFMIEFGHLIDHARLEAAIDFAAHQIVKNEHKFSELAFRGGDVPGLTLPQHIDYIDSIADMRLTMFGFKPKFGEKENPYDWLDGLLGGVELASLFDQRGTSYTRNATTGDWDNAWSTYDNVKTQSLI
jgi:ribonucleoside-diphosphate reductase beta chain